MVTLLLSESPLLEDRRLVSISPLPNTVFISSASLEVDNMIPSASSASSVLDTLVISKALIVATPPPSVGTMDTGDWDWMKLVDEEGVKLPCSSLSLRVAMFLPTLAIKNDSKLGIPRRHHNKTFLHTFYGTMYVRDKLFLGVQLALVPGQFTDNFVFVSPSSSAINHPTSRNGLSLENLVQNHN